jgi:hypothetical protein
MTQSRMDNRKIQATLGKNTGQRQTKQQQLRMNTDNIGYMTQNDDKAKKKKKKKKIRMNTGDIGYMTQNDDKQSNNN